MTFQLPPTMRAWQYSSTTGGLEKNLQLNSVAPIPKPGPNQHLVQVIATALNPVDYKPTEAPLVGLLLVRKPATPGIDFAGRVVIPADGSPFKPGQLVCGAAGKSPLAGGALAEFALCEKSHVIALPDGVDPVAAATLTVAGLTAYQSIVPNVKEGDHIFINGGSGGTGIFGIQFAKAVGCHVTTSCSTTNVELCKSLGADEVIDYTKGTLLEALKSSSHKFDHAVDNVGVDRELYWQCHEYLQPAATYVLISRELALASLVDIVSLKVIPSFLGGIKRRLTGFFPDPKPADLESIVQLIKEGKVKPVIDQKFSFEQAVQAFEKLKTKRAKGKIVIDVASETHTQMWTE
ncbi:zinc alcohol dehydrogenase [Phlyctema vagabunda]|uniref:Zinc alcohol dehydrogenase n=1 Tax=Phlyctema vagabunda TaxID=108571 RepID=A0ABR4PX93_9HELO